ERLLLLMDKCGSFMGTKENPQVFVAFVGDAAQEYALALTKELRTAGVRAEMDTQGRKLKGQLNLANSLDAVYSVVIGDDEIANGELTVRNMAESTQEKVQRGSLIEYIRSK
ncbi:MAG: hypothetical protein IJH04_07365, partial [Eggerthellaceae bacterium]|nr:hypothetical protein [Eggerthellaceae bacterium]